MTNLGIDYGIGIANIDDKTGIRYGVISQNTVGQAWYDESEPTYGEELFCPDCGNEMKEQPEIESDFRYYCKNCEQYRQEASRSELGMAIDDDEYSAWEILDSEIMIVKSPFYTFCQFCSPCVPGAGNLDVPMGAGTKAYCFGHDWFENGRAPYPVYEVATGKEIQPGEHKWSPERN